MTKKNRIPALLFWMILSVIFLTNCGGRADSSATAGDGERETGSLSFNVNWDDGASVAMNSVDDAPKETTIPRAAVDCAGLGIEKVNVIIYNNKNDIIGQKEWSCDAHGGTIGGIPAPQTGATIVVAAKNSAGDIVHRGEKGGLNIKPGGGNTAGEVTILPFMATSVAPGDSANSIQWDAVEGAAEYRVAFSTTEDFDTATDQRCTENICTAVNLSPETLYYTIIYARDAFGNEGAGSAVGSMTTESAVPLGPENVTAEAGDRKVTLNWTSIPGAVYNIYWSTEPGLSKTDSQKLTENLDANTFVHEGCSSDTRYYYIVTAIDATGESDPIGEVSAAPGWINLLPGGIVATSSILDADDNLYLLGYTREPVEGHANLSGDGFLLAKLDMHGELKWAKLFGNSEDGSGKGIGVDAAGNVYILVKKSSLTGISSAIGDLMMISSEGEQQWRVPLLPEINTGEVFMTVDSEGNSYVAGNVYVSETESDVFIAQYDKEGGNGGQPNWIQYLSTPEQELIYSIATDGTRGIYVTGLSGGNLSGWPNIGRDDIFVAKFLDDGALQWVSLTGTPDDDLGMAVTADPHSCYISGAWRGELYFAKFAGASGLLQWNSVVDTLIRDLVFENPKFITILPSGNILAGTNTHVEKIGNQTNKGGEEILLLSYDRNGGRLWSEFLGTVVDDFLIDLKVDSNGYAYIVGNTKGDFGGYANSGKEEGDTFIYKHHFEP